MSVAPPMDNQPTELATPSLSTHGQPTELATYVYIQSIHTLTATFIF